MAVSHPNFSPLLVFASDPTDKRLSFIDFLFFVDCAELLPGTEKPRALEVAGLVSGSWV
jgi:hypothetical protein